MATISISLQPLHAYNLKKCIAINDMQFSIQNKSNNKCNIQLPFNHKVLKEIGNKFIYFLESISTLSMEISNLGQSQIIQY